MLERVRKFLGRRPMRGIVGSLGIHAVLLVVAVFFAAPPSPIAVKRGEPLFVELPELPGPAPAGNPAARTPGPPAVSPPPRPKAPEPARASARPAPRPAAPPVTAIPPTPSPPAPPVVASRPPETPPPAVASRPPKPAPQPSEPDPPLPAEPQGQMESPRPVEPPRQVEPPPEPARPLAPSSPAPEGPTALAPAQPAAPAASDAPAGPQVASVPPSREPPPVDIRSLGRGGGAGGFRGGRGGIEGEPIPLDSPDAKYSDWLERVRRQIKEKWGYPCVKNPLTRECEYKTATLVVEFGVLRGGQLQFIEVRRPSGFSIYDDYAANAIKLGAPFPQVPDAMMTRMVRGSTGVAIQATFNYVVSTSLTNVLR